VGFHPSPRGLFDLLHGTGWNQGHCLDGQKFDLKSNVTLSLINKQKIDKIQSGISFNSQIEAFKLEKTATRFLHQYKLETFAGCFPNRNHCQRTTGSPDPGSGENRRNVERLEDRGRRIQDRVLQLQLRSVRASQLLEPDLRIDHPLGIALPEFTISRSPMPLSRQSE
jgi:hypothetical protein